MSETAIVAWPTKERVALRFALVYLIIAMHAGAPAFQSAEVGWIFKHVLGIPAPRSTGAIETVFYLGLSVAVALMIAVVWSFADRRPRNYDTLHDRLRIAVRYMLATFVIVYGVAKLVPEGQFGPASLSTLLRPFGRFQPMDVLWEFMGYSYAYTLFTGLGELSGSVLLFFRRTTTLGALILVAILGNVVVLDFAYDVPPKINATNYLLMAIFLLVPDMRRLFDAFVRNRPVPPARLGEAATSKRARAVRRVLKPVIVTVLTLGIPVGMYVVGRVFGLMDPQKPALFGIYEVDEFQRNGVVVAPLLTDSVRWRRVVVEDHQFVFVQRMNDRMEQFRVHDDTVQRRWSLTARADTLRKLEMEYRVEASGAVRLAGRLGADSVHLRLRKVDHSQFPLLSHRF